MRTGENVEMTASQRRWEGWMDAYQEILADPGARPGCPSHGDGTVHVAFTGDLETRLGYATVWCDACHEGIAISRGYAPAGLPLLPFGLDPAERARTIPADVELLPPDPYVEDGEEETF